MTGDKKTNLGISKEDDERPSHTTHYSVVDKSGNVVSFTTTIELQPKFSIATQDYLRSLGHASLGAAGGNACTSTIGSVQGVVMDLRSGRQYGGADPRREGTVIGLKPKKAPGIDDDNSEKD